MTKETSFSESTGLEDAFDCAEELRARADRLEAMQSECTVRFPVGPFPGTARPATCLFASHACEESVCPLHDQPHPDLLREVSDDILRALVNHISDEAEP